MSGCFVWSVNETSSGSDQSDTAAWFRSTSLCTAFQLLSFSFQFSRFPSGSPGAGRAQNSLTRRQKHRPVDWCYKLMSHIKALFSDGGGGWRASRLLQTPTGCPGCGFRQCVICPSCVFVRGHSHVCLPAASWDAAQHTSNTTAAARPVNMTTQNKHQMVPLGNCDLCWVISDGDSSDQCCNGCPTHGFFLETNHWGDNVFIIG